MKKFIFGIAAIFLMACFVTASASSEVQKAKKASSTTSIIQSASSGGAIVCDQVSFTENTTLTATEIAVITPVSEPVELNLQMAKAKKVESAATLIGQMAKSEISSSVANLLNGNSRKDLAEQSKSNGGAEVTKLVALNNTLTAAVQIT